MATSLVERVEELERRQDYILLALLRLKHVQWQMHASGAGIGAFPSIQKCLEEIDICLEVVEGRE